MEKLTLNEAVARFYLLLKEAHEARMQNPDSGGAPEVPLTEQEYETQKFRFAKRLIEIACPDPTKCANRRCRRAGCGHLADLAARQKAPFDRELEARTPATQALRHAMWIYMNAQLARAGASPSQDRGSQSP